VLAAAAAVHLAVAVLDFPTLARNGFLYDDSFYAFQIARHIAAGQGPTFDGIHLTNGFQPLYVAMLVPLYAVAGGSETLPIHLALALSALLSVGSAYLLYRLLAGRVGEAAATIASAVWAFSPIVVRQSANGLETSLALFAFACSITHYLERVRPIAAPPRRRFVAIGALLGATILARVDLGLLALAMCLDYLLVLRRRGARAGWVGDLATATVTGALLCAPWVLYSVLKVGTLLPESGRATRFLALAYAPFFGLGDSSMATNGPTWSFMAALFVRSIESLRVVPLLHPLFRGTSKIGERVVPGSVDVLTGAIAIALAAACMVWWWRRRRIAPHTTRELDFLLVFSIVLIVTYSSVVYGVFFFLRYYYPVYFVAMIFAGLAIDDAIVRVRSHRRVRRLALSACGAYAAALMFMGYTSAFRSTPVYRFYDAACWIRTHTDASETIGAFQSGAIGYLSHRTVIGLDGKVNGEAYAALRGHRMNDYVAKAGVDFVIDNLPVLDLFLGPWSDTERQRIESERAFSGREYGLPGWIGYRISSPHGVGASTAPASRPRRDP
jgi:4-amino-4-deoxy-L-arabinose transferase-like glycosyltransferase